MRLECVLNPALAGSEVHDKKETHPVTEESGVQY